MLTTCDTCYVTFDSDTNDQWCPHAAFGSGPEGPYPPIPQPEPEGEPEG